LSGFKPLLLSDRTKGGWKKELAREFSPFRLDLFLIGLLWLKFFNIKYEHLITKDATLQ
jgi:hypothetical protein